MERASLEPVDVAEAQSLSLGLNFAQVATTDGFTEKIPTSVRSSVVGAGRQ